MKKQLPVGWEWKKFYDIAEIISDKITSEKMNGENQKYIGLDNIEKDTGNLINYTETDGMLIKSDKSKFTLNDILYGKLRPYLNKVYLPNFDGVCSTDILVIQPFKDKVVREYLAVYMRHPDFVNYANKRTVGANLPRISPKNILNSDIPVPTINNQRKIVVILKQIETIRQLRSYIDELANKVILSIFFDMFGDPIKNPMSWDKVKVKDITSYHKQGLYTNSNYSENGVKLLRISDIKENGKLNYDTMPYLDLDEKTTNQYKLDVGDIVFARSGSIGRCGIVEEDMPCVFGSFIIKFRFKSEIIDNRFFIYFMRLPINQNKLKEYSHGSANTNVNAENIKDLEVYIPPIALQKKFSEIVKKYDAIRERQYQSRYEISTLQKIAITKAFAGELVS